MKPIKTASTSMTYYGPTADIGNLPCNRMQTGQISSVWKPSPDERRMIAEGGNIEVVLYTEPIPPLSVMATDEQEVA